MPRTQRNNSGKSVENLRHDHDTRPNIPTAEHQALLSDEQASPLTVAYSRRNPDLDPQLVWRGKHPHDDPDAQNDLGVSAPPLYIQEKVHPKALVADLLRRSQQNRREDNPQADMFADFNGLPEGVDRTEFYQHDANWTNRIILGDSLQVMASLSEREGLQGKVQCIYIDPPYGIRFNSNFQWSTTSRDVRDGNREHITREPEQVKAFRDTWRDGIHSYLSYLRDRLTVARDLLADSGSIFVQIGDENVHRVRTVMDEVFGEENFIRQIVFSKTGSIVSNELGRTSDYLLWYSKNNESTKYRELFLQKEPDNFYNLVEMPNGSLKRLTSEERLHPRKDFPNSRVLRLVSLESPGSSGQDTPFEFEGEFYRPNLNRHWSLRYPDGMEALRKSGRIVKAGNKIRWKYFIEDYPLKVMSEIWNDTAGFSQDQIYVVETRSKIIQRCILMTTDPGDLVIDPTCGSGTTAYVAEQWGRRWITIDTSRVALALARARIMGASYPYYILADSKDGQLKEAELARRAPSEAPTYGNVRHGFVYERVPHITLRAIANNAEIDVIYDEHQQRMEPLREKLNNALRTAWEEWEIPRDANETWPEEARALHSEWWELRIARQREIDASIAAHADYEYLYDKPCEDRRKARVAGPFTVESVSPHRVLGVDENGNVLDSVAEAKGVYSTGYDFGAMILENLKRAGVQQAHKEDRITFTSLEAWPGEKHICAEGRYSEGGDSESSGPERRAAVFIGPEFGTVSRPDLVEAAKEAAERGFDVLIACAFNYEAHTTEFEKLGRIRVLKARMNADLHMANDLKNTGAGNLFVIFGEPDFDVLELDDGQIQVRVNGVDTFHPNSGEVRSHGPEEIACWFIDTDYNQESFFVRHAYFLGGEADDSGRVNPAKRGGGDPYKSLKTTLKAEIDEDAWATLYSGASRPFPRPESGRIAVKIINHLGDEVMKVFRVGPAPSAIPE